MICRTCELARDLIDRVGLPERVGIRQCFGMFMGGAKRRNVSCTAVVSSSSNLHRIFLRVLAWLTGVAVLVESTPFQWLGRHSPTSDGRVTRCNVRDIVLFFFHCPCSIMGSTAIVCFFFFFCFFLFDVGTFPLRIIREWKVHVLLVIVIMTSGARTRMSFD